jgi:hypothetical protein
LYSKPAPGQPEAENFQDGENNYRLKAHNKRQNNPSNGNGLHQFENNEGIRDGVRFSDGIQDGGHFQKGNQNGGRFSNGIQDGGHFDGEIQDVENVNKDDSGPFHQGIQNGGHYQQKGIQNGGHRHRGNFQNGKRHVRPGNPGRFSLSATGEEDDVNGDNFHKMKLLKHKLQKGPIDEDEHLYRVRIYDKQQVRPTGAGGGTPPLPPNLGDTGEDLHAFFEGGTPHFLDGGRFPHDGSAHGGEPNNFDSFDIVDYDDHSVEDNGINNGGGITSPGGHNGGRHHNRHQAGLSSGEIEDGYPGNNNRRRRFRGGGSNGGLNRGPLVQDLSGGRPLAHISSGEVFLDNVSGPEFTGRPQRPRRIRAHPSNNGGPPPPLFQLQIGHKRPVRNGGNLRNWFS